MTGLDQTDLKIIRLLEADGRMSYSSIAKEVGVSTGTARNRVQRMLDDKYIQVAAYPNPNRDKDELRAFITFSVLASHLRSVAQELMAHPQVRYAAIATGGFDIVVLSEFSSKEDMLSFITDSVSKIPGITGMQSHMLLSVLKSLGRVLESLESVSAEAGTGP